MTNAWEAMMDHDEFAFEDFTIQDGPYGVEWESLGEGLYGDYDPTNPQDIALLRANFTYNGKPCYDGSYYTLAPVGTPRELLEDAARALIWAVRDSVILDKVNDEVLFDDHTMQVWTHTEYRNDGIVVPRNGPFKYWKYVRP